LGIPLHQARLSIRHGDMKLISAEYTGDFRCKVHHEFSNSVVITDASKTTNSKGFTPPELFAISVATCMATMMGFEADALKLDISGMQMSVGFEMSNDKPRRITKISTEFWVPTHVTEHQKDLLIRAAKNCPITYSIHPDIEHSMEFHYSN
jgi:putative redox protein